ncbi:MAG: hypothetical protein ACP5HG_17165 [Anaerolineae bacterium]
MRFSRQLICCLLLGTLLLAACQSQSTATPVVEDTPAPTAETQPSEEEASEEGVPEATAEPTQAPEPTTTLAPTDMPEPQVTPTAGVTPTLELTPTLEITATPTDTVALTPTETVTSVLPTATPRSEAVLPLPRPTLPREQVVATSALTIRPDEAPAPPLTVVVSANRKLEGNRYKVSGILRNDGEGPYGGLSVIATFFKADGSRFGPIPAQLSCPVLEVGAECPFLVEAIDPDLTEVMLHPDGHPTELRAIPAEVRGVSSYVDDVGWVHITGSVYNPNPVAFQDVSISGALLDRDGEIVSVGTGLVLDPVPPEGTARFDVAVRYAPYVDYELYVQALAR